MNVIITGASSGIGRETALSLARKGHALVLAARRDNLISELAMECLKLGAKAAIPVPCDVTQPTDIQRIVDAIPGLPTGETLVLINNAGYANFETFSGSPIESQLDQIEVNLFGTMRVTKAILPFMLEAKAGKIINVSSIASTVEFVGGSGYAVSKAGMSKFGRILAKEVRDQGIAVTNVHPGATDTEIWDHVGGGPDPGKMMPASAIADALVWVAELPFDRTVEEITLMPPLGFV